MKLIAALALVLLAPAAALADVNEGTETVRSGTVTATLTWGAGDESPADLKLTIVRDGATAYDRLAPQLCGEFCDAPPDGSDFSATDLDGDGEPEIVFNGLEGSHCCGLLDVMYFDGTAYREFKKDFGTAYAFLDDLDHDGRIEVSGRDTRFSSLFEDGSTQPLAIYAYSRPGGVPRLSDVTRHFRSALLGDATIDRLYAEYLTKKEQAGEARAAVGSYVADEFLLGRGQVGLRFLDRQARRGIMGSPREVRKFRRRLLAQLHRYGYR